MFQFRGNQWNLPSITDQRHREGDERAGTRRHRDSVGILTDRVRDMKVGLSMASFLAASIRA